MKIRKKVYLFRNLFLLVVVVLIGSCAPASSRVNDKKTDAGIPYQIFQIEGMPCVYVTMRGGTHAHAGMSCDWSKWEKDKP